MHQSTYVYHAVSSEAFEEKFGGFLTDMSWVNFGGGHHITREGYGLDLFVKLIHDFKSRHDITVYIEPGEAVALNAGYLVSTVLDIVKNGAEIAILDTSAACHMPDVIEMPYTPPVFGAKTNGDHAYRLAGPTCLAGDIIGDYRFDTPLSPDSRVVFGDMAIYSMVKNNTFNGIGLPDIAVLRQDGRFDVLRSFGFDDFRCRLS